ncbi:prenyltransferase [Athalassotoga saccharophila]|uniref:prenyltransferase n=1 Tax=Athalassotoga saccharophila TaxID=1441386 RepID=UPI00137B131A|nr:prenyltransferase [Athalassotoga saccharophila]BBJ28308.1 1,4-dihydroxy-2-naphthoate octaprenyltransferase [Athalassotoga saccharophila]
MKYFLATRPYVVGASLIPFTIGAFLALREGHFSLILYILGGLSLVLIHLASNSANDYFDYKHGIDRPGTFGSSGSRLLINGKITLKEEKYVMITTFVLAIFFGILTVVLSTPYILIFGALGLAGGYFYTADPVNLKYHGLSVPSIFLIYGILITLGGYFLMARTISANAILFAVIIGLPVTNIVLANEIRDTQNDRVIGIKSLTLIFGDIAGSVIYLVFTIAQFVLALYALYLKDVSAWSLISLASVPLYVRIIVKLFSKSYGKISGKEIMNIDVESSNAMLVFGIGILIGLI